MTIECTGVGAGCIAEWLAVKDDLIVETAIVIDNKTLKRSYFVSTNYHFDHGISDSAEYSKSLSKKQYTRRVSMFKQITGKKLRHYAMANDRYYTRLQYRLV